MILSNKFIRENDCKDWQGFHANVRFQFGRNRKLRLEIEALKHSGLEELQLEERRLPLAREHEKTSPEIDTSYDNG